MASFYDITVGQQVEFQRMLSKAGFTDLDITRIIKEPHLASAMYKSIQPGGVVDPPWYVPPYKQLQLAEELWPDAILPDEPSEFVPQTSSEVLLLHVPDSFDSLWEKVVAPEGYSKKRHHAWWTDSQSLRLAPNKHEYTEPVWLAFDPEHGMGLGIDTASLWGQPNLAASEVLSALIQFPEWPFSWSVNGRMAPNLSGYQVLAGTGEWTSVPCLMRNNDTGHVSDECVLSMDVTGTDESYNYQINGYDIDYSSPTVREC